MDRAELSPSGELVQGSHDSQLSPSFGDSPFVLKE